MGTGELTVTQVTDFVLKLQYVFWIVVIFETVMSTGHKTQKKVMHAKKIYGFVFFLFIIIFIISLKMSVADVCCICMRNL